MRRYEHWKPLIREAQGEGELLRVVNEFSGTWLPSDLAELPEDCRQCGVDHPDEIAALAVTLARAELLAPAGSQAATMLHEMAATFVEAAQHLRRLRAAAPKPAEGGR